MRKIADRVLRASPVVYGAMVVCAAAVRADNCSDPSDCQAVPGNVDWTTGFAISGIFILICWRLLGPRLTKRPSPPPAPPVPPDYPHAVPPLAAGAFLATRQREHGHGAQWDEQAYGAAPPAHPGYHPYPPTPAPPELPPDAPPTIREITEPTAAHEGITVRDLSAGAEGGRRTQPFSVPGDQPADLAGRQGASEADRFDRQARPVDAPGGPGDQPADSAGRQGASEADFAGGQPRPVDAPGAPGDRGHDALGARQWEAEHDIGRAARHPEAVQQPPSPATSPPEASTSPPDMTGRPGDLQHGPPGAPSEGRQYGHVPGTPGARDVEHSAQSLSDTGLEHGAPRETGSAAHAYHDPPAPTDSVGAEHGQIPGAAGRPGDQYGSPAVPGAERQHGFSPATPPFEHSPQDAPRDAPGTAGRLGAEHGASGAGASPDRQHTGPPQSAGDAPRRPSPASGPPGVPVEGDEGPDRPPHERKRT